jgi:hypothetical protein
MCARLGDRDPVYGAVELSVAAAVEAVAAVLAGTGFERCNAGGGSTSSNLVNGVDR